MKRTRLYIALVVLLLVILLNVWWWIWGRVPAESTSTPVIMISATPTEVFTATGLPTVTGSPVATDITPTQTAVPNTHTPTSTPTPTPAPSDTPTATATAVPSDTPTPLPPTAEPPPACPRIYTVVPGDHLWGIAARYYGDGRLWVIVYEDNQASIRNPSFIFAGQEFDLSQELCHG